MTTEYSSNFAEFHVFLEGNGEIAGDKSNATQTFLAGLVARTRTWDRDGKGVSRVLWTRFPAG